MNLILEGISKTNVIIIAQIHINSHLLELVKRQTYKVQYVLFISLSQIIFKIRITGAGITTIGYTILDESR